MAMWSGNATLTSDASGDATGTIAGAPFGIVKEILIVNDGTATPTDNWDITVKNVLNSVDHDLLVDTTVSHTGDVRYKPVLEGSLPADGTDQTLIEFELANYGQISLVGANMGASKIAYVYVIIEC